MRGSRHFLSIAILFINLLVCFICIAQTKITVAVAANMQYTVQALKAEFQKSNNVQVDVVLGSSGNLAQQIMQGAPFDIFISADTIFPQKLYAAILAAGKPKVYAQGLLVLWTTKQNIQPKADLQLLLSNDIKSIAVANPKIAPYGAAAEAILKKYNLYNKVSSKFATGESITQTSQFIATQAADIGFTAKSIVVSYEMNGKGRWIELNQRDYPPIKQAAVLLKYGQQHKEAMKFYNFLFSAQAKAIYKNFGYIVNY